MNLNGIKNIDSYIKSGLFASFLFLFFYLITRNVADPDLWGIMSFGRLFRHSHNFPYQDVFSNVPTLNPVAYHEWLTGLLFYPLYQTMGEPGLQILNYSLILTTMALVYLTARRQIKGTIV